MAQAVLENLIDSGVTLYPIGRKTASWEWISCEEAIAELEALQQRSCEGCKHGKYGADSRGIEVGCTLIWHCARGNGFPDRYEPKGMR